MVTISIVMPVYNSENTLEESIQSILDQTFTDFELICIDDGSFDKTPEILQKLAASDDRITVISQENKGAGSARNLGFTFATGEYVFFLDADDLFDKELLEKCYRRATEYNSDLVLFNHRVYDMGTGTYCRNDYALNMDLVNHEVNFDPHTHPKFICQFCIPCVWTRMYRRDLITKNNLSFQTTKTVNDAGFALKALLVSDRASIVEEKLLTRRLCSGPHQISGNYMDSGGDFVCFLNDLMEFNSTLPDPIIYQQSIVNIFVQMMAMSIKMAPDRRIKQIYNYLVNDFSEITRFSERPPEYFHDMEAYEILKNVISEPFDHSKFGHQKIVVVDALENWSLINKK